MAVAARKQGTRDKILQCCKTLFNERGPDSVTTAEIASAAGINEGNLYYHFQRKELMLEALFDLFEMDLHATAGQSDAIASPELFSGYIESWFRLMWVWRFFYRDGASIHRLAPALRQRLRKLSADGQAQTRAAIDRFTAAGLMNVAPGDAEHLIVNAWIIATYWIDFLRSTKGISRIAPKHLAWGARQIASVFAPYLTSKGRKLAQTSASATAATSRAHTKSGARKQLPR